MLCFVERGPAGFLAGLFCPFKFLMRSVYISFLDIWAEYLNVRHFHLKGL